MMDSIASEVTQVIDMIAGKLGVAAEKVYPMLLKQAEVFRSTYHVRLWVVGVAAVMMIVSIIGYIIANHGKWNSTLEDISVGAFIVSGGVLILAGLVAIINLTD
jgi:hypothetical protein